MNNKVFIVWQSQGSYDDYHKSIYKIYNDESLANAECERLNQGLKDEMAQISKVLEDCECTCWNLPDDEWKECDICKAEYKRNVLLEKYDYKVEGFSVEGER